MKLKNLLASFSPCNFPLNMSDRFLFSIICPQVIKKTEYYHKLLLSVEYWVYIVEGKAIVVWIMFQLVFIAFNMKLSRNLCWSWIVAAEHSSVFVCRVVERKFMENWIWTFWSVGHKLMMATTTQRTQPNRSKIAKKLFKIAQISNKLEK